MSFFKSDFKFYIKKKKKLNSSFQLSLISSEIQFKNYLLRNEKINVRSFLIFVT